MNLYAVLTGMSLRTKYVITFSLDDTGSSLNSYSRGVPLKGPGDACVLKLFLPLSLSFYITPEIRSPPTKHS